MNEEKRGNEGHRGEGGVSVLALSLRLTTLISSLSFITSFVFFYSFPHLITTRHPQTQLTFLRWNKNCSTTLSSLQTRWYGVVGQFLGDSRFRYWNSSWSIGWLLSLCLFSTKASQGLIFFDYSSSCMFLLLNSM